MRFGRVSCGPTRWASSSASRRSCGSCGRSKVRGPRTVWATRSCTRSSPPWSRTGHGYVATLAGRPTAYYPIGFPGSLGVWFWLLDLLPWTIPPHVMVTMFNFVPSLAIVVFTYLIACALYGQRIAFFVGLFVALWPNLIFASVVAMSETLFMALLLAALFVLVARPWDRVPAGAVGTCGRPARCSRSCAR